MLELIGLQEDLVERTCREVLGHREGDDHQDRQDRRDHGKEEQFLVGAQHRGARLHQVPAVRQLFEHVSLLLSPTSARLRRFRPASVSDRIVIAGGRRP